MYLWRTWLAGGGITCSHPGLSAPRFATRDRPGYQRLLAGIDADKLDVVVLWEASRGDRKLATWAQFLDACRERGTGIYITSHGRLYDMANGRDWRNLAEDGVDSGYESEKTSIRIQRAVAAKMQAGEPFGHIAYGYLRVYDPRTREPIEQRPCMEPAKPGDVGGWRKPGSSSTSSAASPGVFRSARSAATSTTGASPPRKAANGAAASCSGSPRTGVHR